MEIEWERTFNALAYVLAGNAYVGKERIACSMGQAVLFGAGDSVQVSASLVQESRSEDLEVLILGGRPIQEPVAWYGPFVMNTRVELEQAFEDYRSGRLGVIPAKNHVPHSSNEERI